MGLIVFNRISQMKPEWDDGTKMWEEVPFKVGAMCPYQFRLKTTVFIDKQLGNPGDYLDEVLWWCRDQYDGKDVSRYRTLAYNIYFHSGIDALCFKMRWC